MAIQLNSGAKRSTPTDNDDEVYKEWQPPNRKRGPNCSRIGNIFRIGESEYTDINMREKSDLKTAIRKKWGEIISIQIANIHGRHHLFA